MSEFQILKKLILDGVELTYGKLTLCNLEHYQRFRGARKWQVHSNDRKCEFSMTFIDLNEAIQKFLELKEKISNRVR